MITLKKVTFTLLISIVLSSCSSNSEQHDDEDNMMVNLPSRDNVGGDHMLFPESHASSLIRLDDGNFLVAWFGGTHESNDDVSIWISKGTTGNWSTPLKVAKIREDAHWNPVLFKSPEGKIYLYFKVGKTIPKWETWLTTSDDEGQTWSDATELVPGDKGGRGPVRNKPIVLSDGTWLAGSSNEEGDWNAFVDKSTDKGNTWIATPFIELNRDEFNGKGIIQPTLWESSPGEVHMLFRSTDDKIYRSDSEDYGKTWTPAYATSLPNPNSAIDIVAFEDKTLALVYNPTTRDTEGRAVLSVALSYDNGKTWPKEMILESEGSGGEGFAYPAVISFGDSLAVTYTWKREKIIFWEGTKQQIEKFSEK